MKQKSTDQALHLLAAYCSRAERCIQDVRKKLASWEIPMSEQNKIIQHLQKERFLDESRYTQAFVNDKIKYNHWGIYKIKYELKKKQIPDQLIRDATQSIDPKENRELLKQLLQKKRDSLKGKNEFEIKQKLMRFAAGRGFSMEDIENALK